jgi:hypothetical protein
VALAEVVGSVVVPAGMLPIDMTLGRTRAPSPLVFTIFAA